MREAQLFGDVGQRVTITPDPTALAAARPVDAGHPGRAQRRTALLIPGGTLTEDGKTLSVQAGSKLTSVDDIAALPLSASSAVEADGAPALDDLGDVAAVALTTTRSPRSPASNGQPALTIAVTKLPTANTVDVSNGVQDARCRRSRPTLGDDADASRSCSTRRRSSSSRSSRSTEEGLLGLVLRGRRDPRVPAVDPLDDRHRDLDPDLACSSPSSGCRPPATR